MKIYNIIHTSALVHLVSLADIVKLVSITLLILTVWFVGLCVYRAVMEAGGYNGPESGANTPPPPKNVSYPDTFAIYTRDPSMLTVSYPYYAGHW